MPNSSDSSNSSNSSNFLNSAPAATSSSLLGKPTTATAATSSSLLGSSGLYLDPSELKQDGIFYAIITNISERHGIFVHLGKLRKRRVSTRNQMKKIKRKKKS